MKILIVGAGVAGLAMAAHLRKIGIDFDIIEKASKFTHVGFALGLFHEGTKTLHGFGLEKELREVGRYPTRITFRDLNGEILRTINFEKLSHEVGPAVLVHRADFHNALLKINEGIKIMMGSSVDEIKQNSDSVEVIFSDGTKNEYDLVIGADGIHSRVRELAFKDQGLSYSGLTGWIYLVPESISHHINISRIFHDGKHFEIFPLKDNLLCSYFYQPAPPRFPDPEETRIETIKKEYKNFGWVVPEILNSMTDPTKIFHGDWNEVNLNSWVNNRVVLIGDAAHALPPTSGSGAMMAMEDAAVLSEELAKSSNDISTALANFQHRRMPRVKTVKHVNSWQLKLVGLSGFPGNQIQNLLIRCLPQAIISNELHYLLSWRI